MKFIIFKFIVNWNISSFMFIEISLFLILDNISGNDSLILSNKRKNLESLSKEFFEYSAEKISSSYVLSSAHAIFKYISFRVKSNL